MLPAQYQLPAAIVLLISGTVACFFGYRLFRTVLGIFGFILGSMLASSIFGTSDTTQMIVAAVLGGLLGAGVLMAAYFLGVALVGAIVGVTVANLGFAAGETDPHFLAIVFAAVIGAIGGIYLQRYVIIFGTSFGGAWTLIVGAMAIVGDKKALAAAVTGNVWVAYPLDPAPGQQWVPIAWVVLGLIGAGVQMGITGGEKGSIGRRKK